MRRLGWGFVALSMVLILFCILADVYWLPSDHWALIAAGSLGGISLPLGLWFIFLSFTIKH